MKARRWRAQSWLLFLAVSAISLGLNILVHLDDPREILQFSGGWLVTTGVCVFGVVLWQTTRAE